MSSNKGKALEQAATLVRQGKLPQAIREYEAIISDDPSDLSVLNTLGDLFVWDGKVPEGLRHFYKLAEAYEREGSPLKAIAIYKKIAKLDASSPRPLIKLGEIYSGQGLGQRAREQYNQALALCQSSSLTAEAEQAFHGLLALNPGDLSIRIRAAEYYEAGEKPEAAYDAYLDVAELARSQGDEAMMELALQKASAVDPQNPRHITFKISLAGQRNQLQEIESYLNDSPQLASRQEIKEALAIAYLQAGKAEEAALRAAGLLRESPASFGFIAEFCAQCVRLGHSDPAAQMTGAIAGAFRETAEPDALIHLLKAILTACPVPAAGLEWLSDGLARSVTHDEAARILENLANLYMEANNWDIAESVSAKLFQIAPNSEPCLRVSAKISEYRAGPLTGARGAAPPPQAAPIPNLELISAQTASSPQAGLPAPGVFHSAVGALEIDFFDEWKAFVPALFPSEAGSSLPVAALEIDFLDEWNAFTAGASQSGGRLPNPAVAALEIDFFEEWKAFTSGDSP
jgi:tetratricopeptide (TPR) repeat protein